jgi:hypothetical protein
MMKRLILTVAFLLMSQAAFAQVTATPGMLWKWDYPTAEAADVVRFEIRVDGTGAFQDAGKTAANDAQTGAGMTSYQLVIPALPSGPHSFATRACTVTSCSTAAAPFAFGVVVITTPTNQRIAPPPPGDDQ